MKKKKEIRRKRGRPRKIQGERVRTGVLLPKSLADRADAWAKERGLPRADAIIAGLELLLK